MPFSTSLLHFIPLLVEACAHKATPITTLGILALANAITLPISAATAIAQPSMASDPIQETLARWTAGCISMLVWTACVVVLHSMGLA